MRNPKCNALNGTSAFASVALLVIFMVFTLPDLKPTLQENKPNQVGLMTPKMDKTSGHMLNAKIELPPPPARAFRYLVPAAETAGTNPLIQPIKPSDSVELNLKKENGVSSGPQHLKPSHKDNSLAIISKSLAKKKNEMQGRVLLRMLEHDKGPNISFAWPENTSERDRLFTKLQHCFDMRVALMDVDGNLFKLDEKSGIPWSVNLDNFSGFVRQPEGYSITEEEKLLGRIASHHKLAPTTPHVRIFPRWLDAVLLGEMKRLVGPGYMDASHVNAQYQISGLAILVTDITVDGRTILGHFHLPGQGEC